MRTKESCIKLIPVQKRSIARILAPWAVVLSKTEGGFLACETKEEYASIKRDRTRKEKIRRKEEKEKEHIKRRMIALGTIKEELKE